MFRKDIARQSSEETRTRGGDKARWDGRSKKTRLEKKTR